MYVFTVKQFIAKLYDCMASNNIYVSAGWGANLQGEWLEKYTTNNDYNRKHAKEIKKAAEKQPCWGFDCICLIKAILWGFNFNYSKRNGGCVYKANGVPDYGTKKFFEECCHDQQWIEKGCTIPAGAIVWTDGHIATSIGDGKVIESTRYGGAVIRIAGIRGVYTGTDLPIRHFDKWGYCNFIDYTNRVKGDINGDGEIDAKDAVLCKKIILGSYKPTEDEKWAADINDDGTVSILDYIRLKRMVLKS